MKEGWEYKKLGDVCSVLDSQRKPITKNKRISGQIPYYGASGIQDYVADYIFDGRYLLVGEDGAKWGKDEKSAYIIEGKSWVNNHAHILEIHDGILDSYIVYYLNHKDLTTYITGTIVPKLTQAALVSIPIPVPPIDQQHRIVSELDLLSSIIEKQKNQLKELDTLAQSIFYDMFGDPVTNEKGWDVSNLEHICDFYNGKAHEQNIVDNGSYILVNSKFISTNGNVYKYSDTQLFPLYVNDIAMVMSDVPDGKALAKCFLVTQNNKFTLNQRICAFRNYQQNPIYLLYFLNRNNYFLSYNDGKGQTNLRKQEVIDCPVLLPPLPLQQQFAEKIQSIETQKTTISKSIAESQKLFDYTMDKYFG